MRRHILSFAAAMGQTALTLFRRRRAAAPSRSGWHTTTDGGALSCCTHCPPTCSWGDVHPGPCRHCIREMQASLPLPECVTGSGGRCVTCEQLHGVSVTHRGRG